MPIRVLRMAPFGVLLLLASLAAPPAPARGDDAAATLPSLAPRLKQLQQRLLIERARRRHEGRDELRARPEEGRKAALQRAGRTRTQRARGTATRGVALTRPKDTSDTRDAAPPSGRDARAAQPARIAALGPNVRVNDPSGDGPGVAQSEQSIGVFGDNLLVAYNDGQGFIFSSPYRDTQGYSYSVDGGRTFVDGGPLPTLPNWVWMSDPVVTVNEKTGEFWDCGLLEPQTGQNGIGVVRATFAADTINWDTPHIVISASNATTGIDKPWMVADSVSGRLYCIYTVFTTTSNFIEFKWSANGGLTWSAGIPVSAPGDGGLVQGARVAAGPNGEVYITWYAIGRNAPYSDFYRFRVSTDGGLTFGPQTDVAALFSNFGSGAPAFNRGRGITFPSMAVDRSFGSHRGRVYVTWNEGVDIFEDPIQLNPNPLKFDLEPNNTPGQATAIAIGDTLVGTLTVNDLDYFRFAATQGQTYTFYVSEIDPVLLASMRIFCGDGATRLAYSQPTDPGVSNLLIFTAPVTGNYYLRMGAVSGTGGYHIYAFRHTNLARDRARDQRDVFVAASDDSGRSWRTPVRVNDDAGWYDNWLPEVGVSGVGKPYVIWYDWRDALPANCAATSQVYLSRSDDGGTSWTSLGPVTDAPSDWNRSASNLAPNQGDYLGIYAGNVAIYPVWADARDSTVDVYMVKLPLSSTPVELSLTSVSAEPGRVTLSWFSAGGALTATVERRTDLSAWVTLGDAISDGAGHLTYADASVTPGGRYAYRITVMEPEGPRVSGESWVDVPLTPRFALHGVRPNPTAGEATISFSLDGWTGATLELIDVAGRVVHTEAIDSPSPGTRTLRFAAASRLRPGVYLVRLTQAGRRVTARMAVVK